MNLRALFRLFLWALVAGFLIDLLRRCWIVEAWTIAPLALMALAFVATRIRAAWRAARRRHTTDFIRPALPRRDIR